MNKNILMQFAAIVAMIFALGSCAPAAVKAFDHVDHNKLWKF